MKPNTVAVATRLLTSEKACGTIAIEITASTAPAATAWAVPTSDGLASASTVPPRTVAAASRADAAEQAQDERA
jgi:hypothetical protein